MSKYKLAKEYKVNMKKRLPQTNQAFPREFRGYGCFVRSEMAIGETATGETLTTQQILDILDAAIEDGAVINNESYHCVIRKQGWVANYTAKLLGYNKTIKFVNSIKELKEEPVPFAVISIKTENGNHFVEANNKGQILFNPDKNVDISNAELDWFILYVAE